MSNKTITKNTLFLYIRMLFNMGVMLYISRVVLQVLGVTDFGIYNLVMGVVILFSFFNGTMTLTTQRFINVEKASGDIARINKIFNLSLINHFLIMVVVIILAETVGLWFLNDKLNIPEARISAANTVYQIALLIALVEIIKVPFNATIVAYEKMSFYASLGLFESTMKLAMVFCLMHIKHYDKLIAYSLLLLCVSLSVLTLYICYVKRTFKKATTFRFYKDSSKLKELAKFSGWMLWGQVAEVGSTQGLNMVVNLFFGVVVNAAISIANQVDMAVYSFVNNFQVAFNPQLVQSYASQDYERHQKLVLATSKYSLYLIAFLSAPVLYFCHTLLTFWLDDPLPNYVEELIQAIILCSLINAMAGPFWMTALAIGKNSVKQYNIVLSIISLCTVPVAYFLFTLGLSPVYAYIGKFIIGVIMQLYRLYFIHRHIKFNIKAFGGYLFNISIIMLWLFGLIYCSNLTRLYSLTEFVTQSAIIEISLLTVIFLFGLNRVEKQFLLQFLRKRIT